MNLNTSKKILACVLALLVLLPSDASARRRRKYTADYVNAHTIGGNPGLGDYEWHKHRPSWKGYDPIRQWFHFHNIKFPEYDVKNIPMKEKQIQQAVEWLNVLKQLKQIQEDEYKKAGYGAYNETQKVEKKVDDKIKEAEDDSSIKTTVTRQETYKEGPLLVEEEMKNGGFSKWKDNKANELGKKYEDVQTLKTKYLEQIKYLEEQVKKVTEDIQSNNYNKFEIRAKRIQIQEYNDKISEIRRKIAEIDDTMKKEQGAFDKQMENADKKEEKRVGGGGLGVFDPYKEPTKEQKEAGMTAADRNKKLPTPF